MIGSLNGLLVVLAIGVLLWGVERYRSQFVKMDLLISAGITAGLLTMVFLPAIFDHLGNMLSLQRRVITILFLGNIALLLCILYLLSIIRNNRERITDLARGISVNGNGETLVRADGGTDEIVVIIPAYNEESTIRGVIDSLPQSVHGRAAQPIVVSDGSTDATAERADTAGATVIEHVVNQGQGGALRTGFEVAMQRNASIVVTMDADGQHPADELDRFVTPIIEDQADYVMGSRHTGSDYSGNSVVRRAGIWTFTRLINVFTKSSITDCTNGYRAIRGSELDKLTLTEERFSAPELIIEARKNGLRIKEIPITVEERQAGETTKPQLGFAIGLARTILATWLR